VNKDDFIYRLRPQPPPQFAARLKAKLDRQAPEPAPRRWMGWPLVLGIFIGGLTFATVVFLLPHLRTSVPGPSPRPDVTTLSARPMSPLSTAVPHSEDHSESPAGATPRQGGSTIAGPAVGEGRAATGPAQTVAPGGESGSGAAEEARCCYLVYDASGISSPQEIARQAVEARQGLFRVLGWATVKPIDMLTGRRAFDADELLKYAVRIEQLAPMIRDVYRLDTRYTGVSSRSVDAIWEHRAEFDAMADSVRVAAVGVSVAARTGDRDESLKAFKRLAEDCYRCHDKYRSNGPQFPDE
jgi:cytochrome c556